MDKTSKIYIAGHRGMVGSSVLRLFQEDGYTNIITRTKEELDLLNQSAVEKFFSQEKPDYVVLAAAKVGGILANNTFKADFIYENLVIASNIIHSAWKHNVTKLINLGSSCIYPKLAPQPIKEEYLLTSTLEPTNEPYAIAKIAAIKMCRYFNEQYHTNFISMMPSNLYGIGDNFHQENSHVIPSMIRKFHDAKVNGNDRVTLWGDGTPKREFLYVDDLSQAILFAMKHISHKDIEEHINVGYGEDISIKELSDIIREEVGFQGEVTWDTSKPNGTPKKLMQSSKINALGWKATTSLEAGIHQSYQWFMSNYSKARL